MVINIDFTPLPGAIPPEIEALIRDNVVNPESGIASRAPESLTQQYENASYFRATVQYAISAEAGETKLPHYTNRQAMIAWLTTRTDYRNATQLHVTSETERINNLKGHLVIELDSRHKRLDALAKTSPSYETDVQVHTIRINALDKEIALLNDELFELPAQT